MNFFNVMYRLLFILVSLLWAAGLRAQVAAHKYYFTLNDVIELARDNSPQAIMARHRFRAAYFSFMDYKATFLPKLTLTANPTSWDRSIRTIESVDADGNYMTQEISTNIFSSTAGLALSQNVGLTGGFISLGSDFSRRGIIDDDITQFTTSPLRLSFSQPLNGYNQFKWLQLIEPMRYEEAKQSYIVQMENVSARAVDLFFQLAIAQVNLNMRETNFNNTEEVLQISRGRFDLGLIAEDALLQVQLRHMQAEGSLNSARIDIQARRNQLRSFLGFRENVDIELIIDPTVPSFKVDYDEAISLALDRNPEIIAQKRQMLEAERNVEQTRSQRGITVNTDATFGMNRTADAFWDAYSPQFDERIGINVRVNIPLLDWQQARNRYRNAQSMLEVTEVQIQQDETDFRQDVFLQVMRFNMQENQLRIAATADTIAQRGYDISYARYMMGKGNITELNIADSDKDQARMSFMNELRTYWSFYYTIRRYTLFDFNKNEPLEEDFDGIIGI